MEDYITIDYVNGSFFIFSEDDALRLRNEMRMVVASAMKSDEAPYFVAPEEVTLLVQYGYARVREAVPGSGCPSSNLDDRRTNHSESTIISEELEKRARLIALGRKAKALKRSKMGDDSTAKELRVTKKDMMETDVSSDEVLEVIMELKRSEKNIREKKLIDFPKLESDAKMFHWLDQYDIPLPCTRQFRARELVYHDLWRKGYYLTCGDQFGSAWLVYEGLPGNVHAKFLCDFVLDDEMLSPLKLISLVRVATQVKKTLLIAIVPSDNNLPHYITFEWFKPYTRDVE